MIKNKEKPEALQEAEPTPLSKGNWRKIFKKNPEKAPGQNPALRITLRCLSVFGVLLLSVAVLFFGGMGIICKGPSESARDLFVTTVMETSFARKFAYLYLKEADIDAIIAKNGLVEFDDVTDTDAVVITEPTPESPEEKPIEIVDVSGSTFKGKMMIVKDPSRVVVGTAPKYGKDLVGSTVEEMVKRENAVAGINAGGFVDIDGLGKGGEPTGIVIKGGKLLHGGMGTTTVIGGFTEDNKFIVGKMSAAQALEKKVRDAVSFGPALVVNGEPAQVTGSGGGLNPRTAIGQRGDGAALLLVLDGRQSHSIGASYKDCVDVMMQFGAVNACNLDGGSSSLMYYEGQIINICASLYGPRKMPTSFIVK